MSFFSAIYKVFSKRKRFATPKEYKLNSKEIESFLVFVAFLIMVAAAIVVVIALS